MTEPREHSIRVERTARYYTLGDEANKRKELWFVIHGYGTLARSFIERFAPIAGDAFIVAPEGLSRFYTKGSGKPASPSPTGASWMTREDRLNEIADYIGYFDTLYHEITANERPQKFVVLGFSQGCPAALRWTANGIVVPDEVLVWSGDVPPDLDFPAYKAKSDSIRTTMVYGDNDRVLEDEVYAQSQMLLRTHGISYGSVRFSGGHEIASETLLLVRRQLGR